MTTCLGPRTELAGLKSRMPPLVSQSKHMRMAAKCCLTEGAASGVLVQRQWDKRGCSSS